MDEDRQSPTVVNEPPAELRPEFQALRAAEAATWQDYAPDFDEAEAQASTVNADWQACPVCGKSWTPHRPHADDTAISALCGFDVVRALNRLVLRQHATHAKRDSEACREAYTYLHATYRSLAPERLAELRLVQSTQALRLALEQFEAAAQAAAAHWRRSEGWGTVASSLRLVNALAVEAAVIDGEWSFDSSGRTLPGTDRGKGRPPKRLLAEIEERLRLGGVSQADIARIDLDGELEMQAGRLGIPHALDGRVGLRLPCEPGLDARSEWPQLLRAAERRVRGRQPVLKSEHAGQEWVATDAAQNPGAVELELKALAAWARRNGLGDLPVK